MEALILNKSSRVIPGLRGTPAGTTMMSAPARAVSMESAPVASLYVCKDEDDDANDDDYIHIAPMNPFTFVSRCLSRCRDVAEISSNSRGMNNII